MGIDQVAQVGDNREQGAGKSRGGKVGETFSSQHSTVNVEGEKFRARLNELEKGRAIDEHEKRKA